MVDLHFHSNVSDGIYSPRELMHLAKENGATLLALTDHDNIDGLAEAKSEADKLGIRFINGVELSVNWNNKVIHIVGLNFDAENLLLRQIIQKIGSGRLQRLRKIADKLETIGIFDLYEGTLALSNNPGSVGRGHMARYLLSQGYISNIQQAFNKYLGEGKIGYIKMQWGNLTEVISAVTQAGGVTVLAHPLRYNLTLTKIREFLQEFVALGGKGIEVSCTSHDYNETMTAVLLANQFDLYASAGSDFHGTEHDNRKVGVTPKLPVGCRPVWQLF